MRSCASVHSARGEVLRALPRRRQQRPGGRPAARGVLPLVRPARAAREPAPRPGAQGRRDQPRHRRKAGAHLRHAVRSRGHPSADQPSRRRARLRRGSRRYLHPLQDRRADPDRGRPDRDHRQAMRGDRARAREAQGLQGHQPALDRDPSPGERRRPGGSPGDRRHCSRTATIRSRSSSGRTSTRCSRTPSTRARTSPT